jgi:DNA-binding winged helix-turn-helix (wHTH) protein
VHHGDPVYRFGPFELDATHRRLRRGDTLLALPGRSMEVLLSLTAQAGQVVATEALIQAGWRDVAVTDSSLVQAIRVLRTVLGAQPDGTPYIETRTRLGYRFAAPVALAAPRPSPAAVDTLLAPYRAFGDGRAALERLDREALAGVSNHVKVPPGLVS